MSGWRRKAFEIFPAERREWLAHARSVSEVLWLLDADVRAALGRGEPNSETVDRAFAFASWCFGPRQHADLRNAAAVAFYEHLPTSGPARRELAARLAPAQLAELEPLFRQRIPEADYDALMAEIARVHGREWRASAGVAAT